MDQADGTSPPTPADPAGSTHTAPVLDYHAPQEGLSGINWRHICGVHFQNGVAMGTALLFLAAAALDPMGAIESPCSILGPIVWCLIMAAIQRFVLALSLAASRSGACRPHQRPVPLAITTCGIITGLLVSGIPLAVVYLAEAFGFASAPEAAVLMLVAGIVAWPFLASKWMLRRSEV